MKKTKGTQGRNPFTKIEKVRSDAIKALIRLREVEAEYNATLGLLPEDLKTDYGRAVMQVADERMEMTEELEQVNEKINEYTQMHRDGLELTDEQESEYQELRDHRSEILEVFEITPDLGTSYADWAAADDELKKRDIGRPKQSIEVQLLRARNAYEEAKAELHALEVKQKRKPSDISNLADEEMSKPRRPGRPKKDPITQMRERLVTLEEKLLALETGVADKEYQEKLAKAPRNDAGRIVGRPPVDPQSKHEGLNDELNTINNQMDFMLRGYDEQVAGRSQLTTIKARIRMINEFIEKNGDECTPEGLRLAKSRLTELQNQEIELVNAMSNQVLSAVDSSDAQTEKELRQKGERMSKILEDARNSRSSEKKDKLLDESEALLSEFGLGQAVNQ